jgi:hypothetical protein
MQMMLSALVWGLNELCATLGAASEPHSPAFHPQSCCVWLSVVKDIKDLPG